MKNNLEEVLELNKLEDFDKLFKEPFKKGKFEIIKKRWLRGHKLIKEVGEDKYFIIASLTYSDINSLINTFGTDFSSNLEDYNKKVHKNYTLWESKNGTLEEALEIWKRKEYLK
ncbi:MAG: hypothetical protein KKA65_03920 [Nanoarchaeota archaeon]|nr:hypothetical protein [Nanoarchaeota archaeon]MBU4351583.1 hypothetical protein [Nanoarchaeota archaeon]MBU4456624.1 hypothetical protein [Nanoarchaeota archaeon]